ncbi:MAG: hypothetical protein ABJC09_17890, partial [Terriglobia bacterium]
MKEYPRTKQRLDAPDKAPTAFGLVKKTAVAQAAQVSVRTIDNFVRGKRIPFVRLSARCIRFHLPSVLAALRKYEI